MKEGTGRSVGEVFGLLIDRNKDARDYLLDVAKRATFAENAIWMIWRQNDPVSAVDFVKLRQEKDEKGKWPKLPPYKLENTPEGDSPTKIAAALSPGLCSYVYDAIANQVCKLYLKNRLSYLGFWERLPVSKDLRIRFRERAIQIRRNPDNPKWYQAGLTLTTTGKRKTETVWMDIHTGGKSEWTIRWLDDVADGKETTSGGTISAKKKRGKLRWQVTQARQRREGERRKVDAIEGRELVCFSPLDGDDFLRCEVSPVNGRPWRMHVEAHDLLSLKHRQQRLMREMGQNYHQSRESAAHGHGRNRAISGKLRFQGRYDRRVNDWIENRSMAIVQFAVDCRCGLIRMEKLSDRDPETLMLGSFPYFKLMNRTQQKAKDAGIDFRLFSELGEVKEKVKVRAKKGCAVTVG